MAIQPLRAMVVSVACEASDDGQHGFCLRQGIVQGEQCSQDVGLFGGMAEKRPRGSDLWRGRTEPAKAGAPGTCARSGQVAALDQDAAPHEGAYARRAHLV